MIPDLGMKPPTEEDDRVLAIQAAHKDECSCAPCQGGRPSFTLDDIATTLRAVTFRGCANEREMQERIHAGLLAAGYPVEREAICVGGRIDFRVVDVGIEVKIKGSLADLTRQCSAYSDDPTLSTILVITTRMNHQRLPATLGGKRLVVLWVGATSL